MSVIHQNEAPRQIISEGRERYLAHGEKLMMVVIDVSGGPHAQPDPFHSHPHEQITYVAEGRVLFFMDNDSFELGAGDMVTVPSNHPHTIQPLTPHLRLVDTFTPVRDDFLEK